MRRRRYGIARQRGRLGPEVGGPAPVCEVRGGARGVVVAAAGMGPGDRGTGPGWSRSGRRAGVLGGSGGPARANGEEPEGESELGP